MKVAIALFAAALGASFACATPTPDALAVALLREKLNDTVGDMIPCIEVDGVDATPAFLTAIRKFNKKAVASSRCVYVIQPSKGSYHRATRRKAMLVSVAYNAERGEAYFGAQHNGLWGVHLMLEVREEDGVWKVGRVISQIVS